MGVIIAERERFCCLNDGMNLIHSSKGLPKSSLVCRLLEMYGVTSGRRFHYNHGKQLVCKRQWADGPVILKPFTSILPEVSVFLAVLLIYEVF